ncbi:hypothetical protein HK101_004373 [Irineochytrium annulatum]|nr:hypothetical protein HK101_004373 [Irineochytrium annulatum]
MSPPAATSESTPLLSGNPVVVPVVDGADAQPAAAIPKLPTRNVGLDLFKGLLMVVMALDHARDGAGITVEHEQWFQMPKYGDNTSLFLLRLVTTFCAPGFFMAMGWGITLFVQSRTRLGWTQGRVSRFFATRGAILTALNFICLAPFMIMEKRLMTIVIFALGINLYVGSQVLALETYLTRSSTRPLVATAAFYVVVFTALTVIPSMYAPTPEHAADRYSFLWALIFLPSTHKSFPIMSVYPPFPWLAPVILGLTVGRVMQLAKLDTPKKQAAFCAALGAVMLAMFVAVRTAGGFGNINPELLSPPLGESWISFFNNVKYPPSVAFLLITLGGDLVVLAALMLVPAAWVNARDGILMIFGASSLMFFVTHQYYYYVLGAVVYRRIGGDAFIGWQYWSFYATGIVGEYFLCRWWAGVKRRTEPDSVLRFF